jgi:hypothetical protein
MDAMEAAASGAMADGGRCQPDVAELVECDHSVLLGRQLRDRSIPARLVKKRPLGERFSTSLGHAGHRDSESVACG